MHRMPIAHSSCPVEGSAKMVPYDDDDDDDAAAAAAHHDDDDAEGDH